MSFADGYSFEVRENNRRKLLTYPRSLSELDRLYAEWFDPETDHAEEQNDDFGNLIGYIITIGGTNDV